MISLLELLWFVNSWTYNPNWSLILQLSHSRSIPHQDFAKLVSECQMHNRMKSWWLKRSSFLSHSLFFFPNLQIKKVFEVWKEGCFEPLPLHDAISKLQSPDAIYNLWLRDVISKFWKKKGKPKKESKRSTILPFR